MSLEQKIEELNKNIIELTEVISSLSGLREPTSPKKEEVIPEVTQEVKTSPEPAEEEKPKRKPRAKKAKVSLQDLKDLAKSQVPKIGRTKVKEIISNYGDKLTDVKESDYEKLAEELKGGE